MIRVIEGFVGGCDDEVEGHFEPLALKQGWVDMDLSQVTGAGDGDANISAGGLGGDFAITKLLANLIDLFLNACGMANDVAHGSHGPLGFRHDLRGMHEGGAWKQGFSGEGGSHCKGRFRTRA